MNFYSIAYVSTNLDTLRAVIITTKPSLAITIYFPSVFREAVVEVICDVSTWFPPGFLLEGVDVELVYVRSYN